MVALYVQKIVKSVSRKVYESIKPQLIPVVDIEEIEGIEVITLTFFGEDVPYSAFGKYYIRIADEDRELSPSELRKIMIRREYEENWENKTTDRYILEPYFYLQSGILCQ